MTNLREMFTAETSILIEYKPSEKQWWITGFDPYEQNVKAKDLTAEFSVSFTDESMYQGFYNKYGEGKKRFQVAIQLNNNDSKFFILRGDYNGIV